MMMMKLVTTIMITMLMLMMRLMTKMTKATFMLKMKITLMKGMMTRMSLIVLFLLVVKLPIRNKQGFAQRLLRLLEKSDCEA